MQRWRRQAKGIYWVSGLSCDQCKWPWFSNVMHWNLVLNIFSRSRVMGTGCGCLSSKYGEVKEAARRGLGPSARFLFFFKNMEDIHVKYFSWHLDSNPSEHLDSSPHPLSSLKQTVITFHLLPFPGTLGDEGGRFTLYFPTWSFLMCHFISHSLTWQDHRGQLEPWISTFLEYREGRTAWAWISTF